MPTLTSSSGTTVNTTTQNSQFYGDAVALPGGGWATMWLTDVGNFNYRVAVQRFDANGQPVGGESLVSGPVQVTPLCIARSCRPGSNIEPAIQPGNCA